MTARVVVGGTVPDPDGAGALKPRRQSATTIADSQVTQNGEWNGRRQTDPAWTAVHPVLNWST